MQGLETRNVLITGASSGIGRAVALALAEAGAFLHLVGRDESRLTEVQREAQAKGTQADVHVSDLADDASLAALVSQVHKELRALDILVHSAGVVSLGKVAEAPIDDLDWQYRVNLRAPYLLTQKLLPLLKAARGQVVFVNSGAGLRANALWSQYAASKHGLKALADSLRQEVRSDGVRVVSVYPGRTASPMQQRVRQLEGGDYDPDAFVQPEDVAAQLVAALALPPRAEVTDLSVRPGPG
jgi:NAD(P)-dependent dehydrogenase (short-subunit alcohol dehydrogenase family)